MWIKPIISVATATICVVYACTSAYAYNIYRVGDVIEGRSYNELLKRWHKNSFSIWAGAPNSETSYIIFKGETGLGDATVNLKYTPSVKKKLEDIVKKALKWANIAHENKADTSKPLGCFGDDRYQLCAKDGNAYDENQMGLSFFAANGGRQADLVLDIVDMNNQFVKTTIYLDEDGMRRLLTVIAKIDEALSKARNTAKDQDLFK